LIFFGSREEIGSRKEDQGMTISRELYRQELFAGRLVTFSSWDGGALRDLLLASKTRAEKDSKAETSPVMGPCGTTATCSGAEASSGR
jgi:hypothetical protein